MRRNQKSQFGQRFRAARSKAGVSLTTVAKRTGISLSSLSRFESGSRQPGFADVCSIARALGTPLLFLATGRNRTGTDPRDLIAHLAYWGLTDLASSEPGLIGEARSFEPLVADSIAGETSPRIIEAIPALVLKNPFSPSELQAECLRAGVLQRIGWLAEVAQWIAAQISVTRIHPTASSNLRRLQAHAWNERPRQLESARKEGKRPGWLEEWDQIGRTDRDDETLEDVAALEATIPPISRKWKILYEAPQEAFLDRARAILGARSIE